MNKDKLLELYIVKKMSTRQVAAELGCSQTNVRYWLNKLNIKRNKKRVHSDDLLGQSKKCPQCGVTKDGRQFYVNGNRLSSWCRACTSKKSVDRFTRNKQEAVNYRGGSCSNCGFDKYLGALEFHHLDPSKKDSRINRMNRSLQNNPELRAELDKCSLLCANCHRLAHAEMIVYVDGSWVDSTCT